MQDVERTSKPFGNQTKGNSCSTHAYVATCTAVINFNILNDVKNYRFKKMEEGSKIKKYTKKFEIKEMVLKHH